MSFLCCLSPILCGRKPWRLGWRARRKKFIRTAVEKVEKLDFFLIGTCNKYPQSPLHVCFFQNFKITCGSFRSLYGSEIIDEFGIGFLQTVCPMSPVQVINQDLSELLSHQGMCTCLRESVSGKVFLYLSLVIPQEPQHAFLILLVTMLMIYLLESENC